VRNIKLILAYDGTDFAGWQRQPNVRTIQGAVEDGIQRVTGVDSVVYASGRTDAGVHAAAQVAHFRTASPIPCANLQKALNDVLPPGIRVLSAVQAPENFHARYSAKAKHYRYRILLSPVCSPFLARFVFHYPYALDLLAMARAARLFEGEHDFTSLAAGGQDSGVRSQEPDSEVLDSESGVRRNEETAMVRTVFSSHLRHRKRLSLLNYDVRGNGFLHHMVRSMVGTLLEVGRGRLTPKDIPRILGARDRSTAGPTAPAQGLCLMRVEY
jgi:tRNA pseudouridine38-40 synthase